MIQIVNLHDFRQAFQEIRPNNFSYEGLEVLFKYLEEMEPQYQLDVIAICCDFTESTLDEFLDSYPVDIIRDKATDEEKKKAIDDHIEYHGFWFKFTNDGKSIAYENF